MTTKKIVLLSFISLALISCAYSMEDKKKQKLRKRKPPSTPARQLLHKIKSSQPNNNRSISWHDTDSRENIKCVCLIATIGCCVWATSHGINYAIEGINSAIEYFNNKTA
jgi:uncharacterized membrane protein